MGEKGISILEVIVTIAISTIGLFAVLTITNEAVVGIKSSQAKLDFLELRNNIGSLFRNSNVCAQAMGTLRIDTTAILPGQINHTELHVPVIREGTDVTSPTLVSEGRPLHGGSSVVVESMIATNFESTSGSVDQLSADFIVRPAAASVFRSIHPIVYRLYLSLNAADPANARRVMACGVAAQSGVVQMCPGGGGSYCVDGKQFYFTNASGVRIGHSPVFISDNEFEVTFMSDSPRFARVHFTYTNGKLIYSPVPGFRLQMCYIPGNAGYTFGTPTDQTFACRSLNRRYPGDTDTRNCMTPIFWKGDLVGNTAAMAYACGPVPANWLPIYSNTP